MIPSEYRIAIPKLDWNGRASDMRSRLMTWEWQWKLTKGRDRVVLDFSRVNFMEPWALSMFAAYGLSLKQQGVPIELHTDPANPSNVWIEEMGLRELLETGVSAGTGLRWSSSHQNTGLQRIQDYADLRSFLDSADRLALAHCEEAQQALRYAMSELARNVLQHAQSPIGGVAMAQYFPTSGRLQVAICDLGCGVRTALVQRYPELRTDMESLRLATLPHSSGAQPAGPYGGGVENAGLGLFYSREIAWRAGGSFWMASGEALLGIRGDEETVWNRARAEPERVYRRIQRWPGTVVVLDFPVDGVPDFAAILRLCGELADEARRMSGPAGLDFLESGADIEDTYTVRVRDFAEDNPQALLIRQNEILPRMARGESTVIDFAGVRSVTQSFVHALLSEPLKQPGSLLRLSFANCTASTREILRVVAAYASYRQIV